MKEIIKHIDGVAGRVVTVTGLTDSALTRDNVLGILNGTQNEVLYVPMFYGDLQSVTYSNGTLTITLADTVPAIANGDKLFVKLYADVEMATEATANTINTAVSYNISQVSNMQGYLQNTIAKEATLGAAPIGSDKTTVFQYLASIYESIVGTVSPDVPEGVADRLAAVMKFFGIYVDGDKIYVKGADPEHPEQIVPAEFMQDSEVTDELEDIMQALDPELLQEVEYPEGSGTYMTKAQAITAEAMQIINPSQS